MTGGTDPEPGAPGPDPGDEHSGDENFEDQAVDDGASKATGAGDRKGRQMSETNGEGSAPLAASERETLREYEKDLRKAEKKVAGEIDPGARAMVVAVCVLLAMVSLVMPHAGVASGLDALTGTAKASQARISLPSEIFVYLVVIFGIGFSALALLTRRWVVAWIALCGCAVASVAGMLAIWTRNTIGVGGIEPPGGAGAGLILGWLVMIVLTFHWARVVWARSSYQLALEEERRSRAAAAEAFGVSLQRKPQPRTDTERDQPGQDDQGAPGPS